MDVVLVMFKADGERRDFPLKRSSVVLGRKRTSDLRIPLPSVSRQHAQIEERDDGLYIRDLGSSNGTYHNGDRIREQKLKAGDTITIGPVHFTLTINGRPAEIEPIKTMLTGTGVSEAVGGDSSASPVPQPKKAAEPMDRDDDVEEIEEIDVVEVVGVEEDDEDVPVRRDRPEAPTEGAGAGADKGKGKEKKKVPAAAAGKKEEDEDPISALEAMAGGEDDDEEKETDPDAAFDAIFGSEDDESVPLFDEDEDKKS